MMDKNENSIGKDLALRRICMGLRQFQVARQVGICSTVLSDYETGKRGVTVKMKARIEAAILELAGKGANNG